jgi:hypothetical protein
MAFPLAGQLQQQLALRALLLRPAPTARAAALGTNTTMPVIAAAPAGAAHRPHVYAAHLPPGASIPAGIAVHPCFLTPDEEAAWLRLAEPALARRRYERAHWDAVIDNFRETQLPFAALMACPAVRATLARAAAAIATPAGSPAVRLLPAAHVLDLAAEGAIRHHVDSVKFSGGLVAGMCLLSDAVMSLRPDAGDGGAGAAAGGGGVAAGRAAAASAGDAAAAAEVRVLLPRRCLYTLTGPARYGWAHAVLPGPQQALAAGGGEEGGAAAEAAAAGDAAGAAAAAGTRRLVTVTKARRVSILLRDPPPGAGAGEGVELRAAG